MISFRLQNFGFKTLVPAILLLIYILHEKMKFSFKDFFGKCYQIRRKLRIWPHLMKKTLMKNFIFCAVICGVSIITLGNYIYSNQFAKFFQEDIASIWMKITLKLEIPSIIGNWRQLQGGLYCRVWRNFRFFIFFSYFSVCYPKFFLHKRLNGNCFLKNLLALVIQFNYCWMLAEK